MLLICKVRTIWTFSQMLMHLIKLDLVLFLYGEKISIDFSLFCVCVCDFYYHFICFKRFCENIIFIIYFQKYDLSILYLYILEKFSIKFKILSIFLINTLIIDFYGRCYSTKIMC